MRALAFVALLILAGLALTVGSYPLAVALAAVKATVVGLVYMDLRHAHRLHAVAFVGAVAIAALALIAAGA